MRARTSPPPPPRSGDASAASGAGGSSVTPVPDGPPQDLSGNWGYSKSRPRTPRYVRTDVSDVVSAANPIGFYSGVSVAGNHVPPRPPAYFNSKPTLLTWAGFERAQEGSRVFLQLNAVAQYSVEHSGQVILIRLRNTKVNVRNNLRALDLRYFKTPVQSVKVRRKGKDTVARIVLKRAATPHVEIIDGKAGYKLLVVQFSDAIETTRRVNPTQKRQAAPKVKPLPASSGS
ncbi:MAG: hypothetical protein JKY37_20280 [Nannocystaceae bacterium]|nr:hypothetical protein [Nannocystaceae bacterium]